MRVFLMSGLAIILMHTVTWAQEKTDRHYPTRLFDYTQVQNDIDELAKVTSTDIYQVAKAQAWLNSSKYEMWRNDHDWWPKEAFEEAQRVVSAIKENDISKLESISTLKVNRLIADELWQELKRQKQDSANCAKILLARAEVELVHAAYEAETSAWKSAESQLAITKSLLERAQTCQ